MTKKVWVSDKLSAEGLAVLKGAAGIDLDNKTGMKGPEQQAYIAPFHALIVRSATTVDAALIAKADNLKLVVRAGIGVDNIDVEACTKKGILVENTPAGNAVSAAEHALALLFSLARKIPAAHMSTTTGGWEKSKFMGIELTGKTLGVIGTGNIGGIVCQRARGLAMNVVAFDPLLTDARAQELGVAKVGLDELLARADFVTLHVPLIDKTKNLIDAAALAKMKKGALLVNASRGGTVDEAAVVASLEQKHLGGAAFDVFVEEPLQKGSPLLGREDVILTPHLGASTHDAQLKVGVEAAEQVVAFLTKGEVKNAVNRL